MNKTNLNDKFIRELNSKFPKRAELVNRIAGILRIENESASRRLSGRVQFTVREVGILAQALNLSLDRIMHREKHPLLIPLTLLSPVKMTSMDTLADYIESRFDAQARILREPAESGSVYNALPMEFFLPYPTLSRFMFFKWGHSFIGTEAYYDFSTWELPYRLSTLGERLDTVNRFTDIFYIWDHSLIWTLAGEIENFQKMGAISPEEKRSIKSELKQLLVSLEEFLNGRHTGNTFKAREMDFFVSHLNIGFSCNYCASEAMNAVVLQTNFGYSVIDNDPESFRLIKEWVKSFRTISTLLSGSGRIERRLFFRRQHEIIDTVLR